MLWGCITVDGVVLLKDKNIRRNVSAPNGLYVPPPYRWEIYYNKQRTLAPSGLECDKYVTCNVNLDVTSSHVVHAVK